MEIEIKLAKEESDILSIHQIMHDAFREYSGHDIPSSAMNETAQAIGEAIQNGIENGLLCLLDGIPSGSARFIMESSSLYFKRLSVVPEARGKGLASAIIHWLENYAKEQGKEKIYCRVRMDTPENIAFYQKGDFVISKEETIINKDGNVIDTCLMEKSVHVFSS